MLTSYVLAPLVTLMRLAYNYLRQIELQQLLEVTLYQRIMGSIKVVKDGSEVFSDIIIMLLANSYSRVQEFSSRVGKRLDAHMSGQLK